MSPVFIHVGQLHVGPAPATISTILGSCVGVCLYDPVLELGGLNHYLLPFWNGNGLLSPKFGNVAIPRLIEAMTQHGAKMERLEAKIFGGAAMNILATRDSMLIGQKNVLVAHEILGQYKIPVKAHDTGGSRGRKILFDVAKGKVMLKYTSSGEGEMR